MTEKEFIQKFIIHAANWIAENEGNDYCELHNETPVNTVEKIAEDAWDYIESKYN